MLRRSVGLVAVALLAAACTPGGPSAKGSTTTSVPTVTTLPSLVADVTPPGWVPVDFGDAQISVPADWSLNYTDMGSGPGCPLPQATGWLNVGVLISCSKVGGERGTGRVPQPDNRHPADRAFLAGRDYLAPRRFPEAFRAISLRNMPAQVVSRTTFMTSTTC